MGLLIPYGTTAANWLLIVVYFSLRVKMEGKLNGLTRQNGVEVCRRIDFQPCGTGNRVGLLSSSDNFLLYK